MPNASPKNPLLVAPPDPESDRQLKPWLETFRRHVGYTELAILDGRGQRRVSASDGSISTSGHLTELYREALETGQGAVSDLYEEEDGSIYIDFLAALPARQRDLAGSVVLIRVEASAFLYAMIQAWPVPSKTAECLLVRGEGAHANAPATGL